MTTHRHTILVLLALSAAAAGNLNAREVTNLQAGQLAAAGISADETELTISGQMNAADFAYIFDNLNELSKLDISNVNITAYRGDALPYTGIKQSPANTLPDYALTGLKQLSTVSLPSSLTAIGKGSLSGTGIAALDIPQSVTSIGDYAAMRCEKLKALTIPAGVTSIGTRAFAYCPALESVNIQASVSQIPEGLFEACGGLTALQLEAIGSCTEIGPWAIAECNGLTTLVLPAGSQALQKGALYGTASIKTLILPEAIDYLGDNAMSAMTSLNHMDASKVQTVPELGNNVWSRIDQSAVRLVTPNNRVEDYRNADQWKEFHIMSVDDWQASSRNIASSMGADALLVTVNGRNVIVDGGEQELGSVSAFNVGGQRIFTAKAGKKLEISAKGWPAGIYLIVTNIGAAKVTI